MPVTRAEQWLSSHVAVGPLGGGNDDWTRIFGPNGTAVRATQQGKVLVFTPGEFVCASGLTPTVGFNLPRGLRWWMSPGTIIRSELTSTGGADHRNSPINYDGFTDFLGATNPAAPVGAGAITMTTAGLMGAANAAALIGTEIQIEELAPNEINQQQAFIVIDSVAAGGGATLTLDRPTNRAFSVASQVSRGTMALGILIWGNGAVVYGTGDRLVSLASARNTFVDDLDLRAPGFDNEYSCSLDSGSYRSGLSRFRVASSPATALALEAAESCFMADCVVETTDPASTRANAAALMQACYHSEIRNLSATGRTGINGAGLLIGFLNDVVGCRRCRVRGGRLAKNLIGLDIRGGSQDVDVEGVSIEFNDSHGVRALAEAVPVQVPGRVRVKGGSLYRNGGVGFFADGSRGNRVDQCKVEENTLGGVATVNGGEIRCEGADFVSSFVGVASAKCNSVDDVLTCEGCDFSGTQIGVGYGVWVAAGKCSVRSPRFSYANGNMVCVVQVGGTLYIDDAENVGAAVVNGLLSVGGTVKIGPNAIFDNTTAPVTTAGGYVPTEALRFGFGAAASLVNAAAQTVYPGSQQATVLAATDALGYVVEAKSVVGLFRVQHTGNAANIAGQTVAYDILVNGVSMVTVTLATTAGVKTGAAEFAAGAIVLQPGDIVRVTATPSAVLTAAVADIMAGLA